MTNDIELGLTLRNILMGINIQAPQVIICVEKRENNKCFVTVNLGSRVQIVAQENKLIVLEEMTKLCQSCSLSISSLGDKPFVYKMNLETGMHLNMSNLSYIDELEELDK